ncbi:MAG: hypothetical protein ABIQ58_06675, partial [Candidatus Limnocylindrales bacterium]
MNLLVRLYPQTWRDRYETEFQGILEARPPSARDRVDIVRGAIDARLHPEVPGSPERPRLAMQSAHLAAGATIAAGAIWLVWVGLLLRDFRGWGSGQPDNAALLSALTAFTLLALAAAHVLVAYAVRTTASGIAGVAGSLASAFFAMTAFGGGLTLAIALIGSATLGATLGGRIIPRWVAGAWAVTAVLVLAVMLGFVDGGGKDVGLLAAAGPFGATLVLAGLILARRGVPSGAP